MFGDMVADTLIWGILGGMLGFIPGAGGIISSTAVGIGSSVLMLAAFENAPTPPDLSSVLGDVTKSMTKSYSDFTGQLFMNGRYHFKSKDGKHEFSKDMSELMKDGHLMEQDNETRELYSSLVPNYERVIFQQMAWVTWQHYESDDKQHIPFIAFDNGKCSDVKGDGLGDDIIKDVASLGTGYDFDGKCFYLLDALRVQDGSTDDKVKRVLGYHVNLPTFACSGTHALPGGTAEDFKKHSGDFGGLSLKDLIEPSVNGWKQHKNTNGYDMASKDGVPVKSPTDAAAINIPVCDYLGNKDAPGALCPKLGETLSIMQKNCNRHPK